MFKKIILILALMCMIAFPVFSQTGSYTTHNLFYLPEYGAYGMDEYNEYNDYMEIADAQIWANKLAFGNYYSKTEVDTKLDLYYFKTEIDSQTEVEAIWGVTLPIVTGSFTIGNLMEYDSAETVTIKDAGVAIETTLTTDSDTKIPTSKAINDFCETTKNYMQNVIEDTTPESGGEHNFGAYSAGFTVQTITSTAGTATINWGNSNKARITLSENTTLAFTNPANSGNYLLIIIQPAGGNAYTTTFPAGIYWANSTKVSVPTTDNNRCIVSFLFDDEDGDKWYCQGTETFATDD